MKVETYKPIGRPYRMRQKTSGFLSHTSIQDGMGEVQAISENACLFFVFSLSRWKHSSPVSRIPA
jgi:hypothetical protein